MSVRLGMFGPLLLFVVAFSNVAANEQLDGSTSMKFGMQVVMTAHAGKGAELGEIMLAASELVSAAPACELYLVQVSIEDSDKILITEVWESQESQQASLADPKVRELIGAARPLIAGMEHHAARPLEGKGL